MMNPVFSAFKHAIRRIDTPNDFDDILSQAGLQRSAKYNKRRIFGWAGFFALGALAGGAAGLFFAPKRGQEMREQLGDQVRDKIPMNQSSSSIPGQEQIYDELN